MATEQKSKAMSLLTNAKPTEVANLQMTKDRFINLYASIHGKERADSVYLTETFHFQKIISENKKLAECTPLSLYGCILDVAVQGLSFDPAKKLCYLIPYPKNVGTKNDPKWISQAQLQISGLGELMLRQRCGQIRHADNPVIVYSCDVFEPTADEAGRLKIKYAPKFPRPDDAQIIASYITITRMDGTTDVRILSKNDIDSFRKQSKDPNGAAWTNNYEGMVIAKTIKHAFKTYPKVNLTAKFSVLETEVIEPDNIDYGIDIDEPEVIQVAENVPAENVDKTTGEVLTPEIKSTPEPKSTKPTKEEKGGAF